MANALNSFTNAQNAAIALTSSLTATPSSSTVGSLAVNSLVSALAQYDASGRPLLGAVAGQSVASQPVLRATTPEISNTYVVAMQK